VDCGLTVSSRGSHIFVALALWCHVVAATTSGCLVRRSEVEIEVQAGANLAEREAIADKIATASRLARLKAEVRRALPDLRDTEIEGLYLRWSTTEYRALRGQPPPARTVVVVGMRDAGDSERTRRVLAYCAGVIKAEVQH